MYSMSQGSAAQSVSLGSSSLASHIVTSLKRLMQTRRFRNKLNVCVVTISTRLQFSAPQFSEPASPAAQLLANTATLLFSTADTVNERVRFLPRPHSGSSLLRLSASPRNTSKISCNTEEAAEDMPSWIQKVVKHPYFCPIQALIY